MLGHIPSIPSLPPPHPSPSRVALDMRIRVVSGEDEWGSQAEDDDEEGEPRHHHTLRESDGKERKSDTSEDKKREKRRKERRKAEEKEEREKAKELEKEKRRMEKERRRKKRRFRNQGMRSTLPAGVMHGRTDRSDRDNDDDDQESSNESRGSWRDIVREFDSRPEHETKDAKADDAYDGRSVGGGAGGMRDEWAFPMIGEEQNDDDSKYLPIPLSINSGKLMDGLTLDEKKLEMEANARKPPFCFLCSVPSLPITHEGRITPYGQLVKLIGENLHRHDHNEQCRAIQTFYEKRIRYSIEPDEMPGWGQQRWSLLQISAHLNRHCNGARIVHEDVLRHLRELFHILVNDGCLNEHSETGRRRLDLAAVNTALRVASQLCNLSRNMATMQEAGIM